MSFECRDVEFYTVNGKRFFEYQCLCDNIPTKYITQSRWNFKITVENLIYKDCKGAYIWILEEGDEGYDNIKKYIENIDVHTGMPVEMIKTI
tara:strand:+ start:329 stop:604 length:276 start_codon:yes stop_codon:yes gene_type:complete